jgi:hypothetical protein
MAPTHTLAENETELIRLTIRLPHNVWLAIRKLALENRTSAQQIGMDALLAYLRNNGRRVA